MIAAIVPAHNEEAHIGACLASLRQAADCPELGGEPVRIVVVADACDDRTAQIARAAGADVVEIDARSVGTARARGADVAMALGARWLSFTDADSTVAPHWIASQLALCADAVCGTIAVHDWSEHDAHVRHHFDAHYTDADGHRHVHGANLGICAHAYRRSGGFRAVSCHEDVALVRALERDGARIRWSAAPRVYTSARRAFRIDGGFGSTLLQLGRTA